MKSSGWYAQLDLRYRYKRGRTVLDKVSHQGPLRVQRPFYPESDLCHTYLLHPPGGMVGGDQLKVKVHATADTQVLLTTPAAAKFYRSTGQQAKQRQYLNVAAGACCEWLPHESILFDGALSASSTQVRLAEGARFIGWDVQCLGRPAAQAPYRRGCHDRRFALYRNGDLFYLDRLRLDNNNDVYHASWGLRSHGVSALLVATPVNSKVLATARIISSRYNERTISACTLIEDVLLCRSVSHDLQTTRRYLTELWRQLRPSVIGRPSCTPRIWLT